MNSITKSLNTNLQPFSMLLMYKKEVDESVDFYVEQFPIINGIVGAGYPLSVNSMLDIGKLFVMKSNKENNNEITDFRIPYNMLYIDQNKGRYVWYEKPTRKNLLFKKDLAIENGEYPIPGLVFALNKDVLSVYAYKQFKQDITELFLAPFMNVNDAGTICLGSAKSSISIKDYYSLIEYHEDLFFNSVFTHLSGSKTINGNYTVEMNNLFNTKKSFPNHLLIPHKIKLYELFR